MEVVLRPMTDEDLDAVFAWESDPRAVRMAAFTRDDPGDRGAFEAHYDRVRADPDVRHRMVVADGELVGSVAAFTVDGDAEITYWVDARHWGRGIATAAVRALLAEEPRRPLHARVAEHNEGSRRVLEHTGFVAIGEERSWAAGAQAEIGEIVLRLD